MKINQFGRSMVEMLGVLAIIGVLSVGAIAGYSKAMFKYKLNKHAQQLNTIINAMSRHTKSFEGTDNGTHLSPIFKKMGEIPKEMIKNETNLIYDTFNNTIELKYVIYTDNKTKFLTMSIYTALDKKSANNIEICKNIILTVKENSANIRNLQTIGNNGSLNDNSYTYLHGDAYCGLYDEPCLKNISMDDIYTACTNHLNKDSTHIKIVWDAL